MEKTSNKEIWVSLPEGDYKYLISNLGNVYSTKRKRQLKPFVNAKGYLKVEMRTNGIIKTYSVHRLVAKAFIPNPNNLPLINHIDGNKKNNCANNLEWCTAKENTQHALKMGLLNLCKPIEQYDLNGNFIKRYNSLVKASIETGIHKNSIWGAVNHYIDKRDKSQRKTAGGFIWKYTEII